MIVIEQPYVEFGDSGATEHDKGWIAITPIQSATDFLGVFSNDTAITREPMDETKQEIVTVFCSLLGAIIEPPKIACRRVHFIRNANSFKASTSPLRFLSIAHSYDLAFSRCR